MRTIFIIKYCFVLYWVHCVGCIERPKVELLDRSCIESPKILLSYVNSYFLLKVVSWGPATFIFSNAKHCTWVHEKSTLTATSCNVPPPTSNTAWRHMMTQKICKLRSIRSLCYVRWKRTLHGSGSTMTSARSLQSQTAKSRRSSNTKCMTVTMNAHGKHTDIQYMDLDWDDLFGDICAFRKPMYHWNYIIMGWPLHAHE